MLAALLTTLSMGHAQDGGCTEAAQYIYTITSSRQLLRFHPQNGTFETVGTLDCGSTNLSPINSMAVSRDGTAYVSFFHGDMFKSDIYTASCESLDFEVWQQGFTRFGMGFTVDEQGQDVLFVTANAPGSQGYRLGRIDTSTLRLQTVGVYDEISARAELTGNAKGELFGAFEGEPFHIAQIDPRTAAIQWHVPIPQARFAASNFAFAAWGGDFYLFVGPGSRTEVYRYDPDSGQSTLMANTHHVVVGAGVSTCAPTQMPSEDFTRLTDSAQPTPQQTEQIQLTLSAPSGTHYPGETITLTAALSNEDGGVHPLTGGTFHLQDGAGNITDIPATIAGDGTATAQITIPNQNAPLVVRFTPSTELTDSQRLNDTAISPLQIDIEHVVHWSLNALPTTCFVGQPCTGQAQLLVTEDAGERMLQSDNVRVRLLEDGVAVTTDPVPSPPQRTHHISRVYHQPKTVSWQLAVSNGGTDVLSEVHTITVRTPLVLQAQSALDFGQVQAGSPTRDNCRDVDLSGSTGLDENMLEWSFPLWDGCESRLMLADDRRLRPLTPSSILPGGSARLCLEVPWCAADQSPPDATLKLRATDEIFSDQAVDITVTWSVQKQSWLRCNIGWLLPTALTAFGLFVLVGFVRPHRFPVGATIVVAGSLKGLRRSAPIDLRTARGGRAKFYRNAALGVFADGSVRGGQRGAIAVLKATKQGVKIQPRAGLERYDKRRRQWSAVDAADDLAVQGSDVYRVGDTCFQVEPG